MQPLGWNTFNPISLYLIFNDGTHLYLTRDNIDQTTKHYWQDPSKIPENVKAAIDFKRCEHCPLREESGMCDALRPVLPLLDHIDRFSSIDTVQVIFSGTDPSLYHIANTTMANALSYVSILSLIYYCQAGRKYRKYYFDILPLSSSRTLALRLYLNIFWLHKGNPEEIKQVVEGFSRGMHMQSENLVKRLNLICHNDAFNNSFLNTYISTALLMMGIEKELGKAFSDFESIT